jgi:hypothetical protein
MHPRHPAFLVPLEVLWEFGDAEILPPSPKQWVASTCRSVGSDVFKLHLRFSTMNDMYAIYPVALRKQTDTLVNLDALDLGGELNDLEPRPGAEDLQRGQKRGHVPTVTLTLFVHHRKVLQTQVEFTYVDLKTVCIGLSHKPAAHEH